jgi:hypothetical protein
MSTKTAQLGGTASDVTVGKVGVSVISLDPPHPDIDLAPLPRSQHGLMMMTCALLFFRCFFFSVSMPFTQLAQPANP